MTGFLAQLPGGDIRFVTPAADVPEEAAEVAEWVRSALETEIFRTSKDFQLDGQELNEVDDLAEAFQDFDLEDEDVVFEAEYRILFQGRDLELRKTAIAFLGRTEPGPPMIRVVCKLLGGKGGFGSLLRSQKGGKKTTNFDAMRDLNGRRIRHVKAVERIKEWLEKKKREDELVNLLTGEGPELPKVTNPESDGLDPEFLRKLKRSAASRDSLVSQGLKHLEDEGDGEDDEKNGEDGEQEQKRMKMAEEEEKKNEKEEDGYDGMDWMGAMSALNALSSGSEDEAGNPSASASASAASSK